MVRASPDHPVIFRRFSTSFRPASTRNRAARAGHAQVHPRYAAPSPDFAARSVRRTAARSAEPGGPRAARGAARPGVSPPPLRCPLPGARAGARWGSGMRIGDGDPDCGIGECAGRHAGGERPRGARSRAARAQPLPRAPSLDFAASAAREAVRVRRVEREAGRAWCARCASPPPLRCPLPGAREVGFRFAARDRRAQRGGSRAMRDDAKRPRPRRVRRSRLPKPREAGSGREGAECRGGGREGRGV